MQCWNWNFFCRILKLLCWTSTTNNCNPSFHRIYEVVTFKHKSSFLGSYLILKILHSKIHKNYILFSTLHNFWKQLLNQVYYTWLNSYPCIQKHEWVIIILVKGYLEFFGKTSGLQIAIKVVTLKITSCRTTWEKKEEGEV